jgi:pyruvate,water dikinase
MTQGMPNSRAIQQLIINAEVPSGIVREIAAAFAGLSATYVAVRSSATLEDSITASWAGQLESFLNTTDQDLLLNVQRCWASIFSDRALSYRMHYGLTSGALSTAVIIQTMVESRISGTAFSVHPVSGKDCSVLIESCVGLGETLVLGRETPATYVVEKETLKVSYKGSSQQSTGIRRAKHGGGNELFQVPLNDNSANILSDDEARELASLVICIERKFGFPVDVEWAYEGDKLYLLQSRPITALANRHRV